MSADEQYDINPPISYDEGRIKKDLIQLSTRGYSIVPYQNRIKSKLYYNFYKKRIDAFFELVEAEKEVWRALREWRMELEQLKMVDIDVANLKLEKLKRNYELSIEHARKEKEYEELTKGSVDDELKELSKKKDILAMKLQIAQLEKKINGFIGEQVTSFEKSTKVTVDKLDSIKQILIMKKQFEIELKKNLSSQGLSEEEVNKIIDDFDRIAKEEGVLPNIGA